MSKINLLPWREEMRKKLNYLFFFILGLTMVSSLFLIALVNFYLDHRLEVENANVDYINNAMRDVRTEVIEIQALQENKKQLIERMSVIQSLEADRTSIIKLLSTLPQTLPDNVYLSTISRKELVEEPAASININKPNITVPDVSKESDKQKFELMKSLQKKYFIEIQGISITNGGISVFLKNLETIKWVSDLKLNEVSINRDAEGLDFKLTFIQNLVNRE